MKGASGRRPGLALLVLLAAGPAAGARTAVRNYTAADGLPQAQATALCQDAKGFLWVGTEAGGVGRYDGLRWEVFDASSGFPGGTVNSLELDPEGRLLAGTNGGAARWDGARWIPLEGVPSLLHAAVAAVHAEPKGRLWLGTRSGLLFRAGEKAPFVEVRAAPELKGAAVNSLEPDGRGGLWVGTVRGLGLVRGGDAPFLAPAPGLPAGSVDALLSRPERPLLLSVSGVGLFEGAPGAFRRVGDDATPGRNVLALLAESGEPDAIWIGTGDRGAFRLRREALEPFGTEQGLLHARVYALLEDREGTLWFGTDSGLTKRGPSAFLTFSEEDGFPANEAVFGMAESADGSLWFAAGNSGLVRLTKGGAVRRFTVRDGLPDARVSDVAADPDGGVLVATPAGVARLLGERFAPLPGAAGRTKRVRTLRALAGGGLVLGTNGDGLKLIRGERVESVGPPVGPDVTALTVAPDGTIWCGGEGWGAVALREGRPPEALTTKDGLPSNQVNDILVDSAGTLWVATDRGALMRSASGEVRVFSRRTGLPDSFVYWVGEDRERAIWFGTNHGAARLLPGGATEVYTSRDGLGADECNEGGFFVDSSGRVFVATVGVSVFLGRPRPRRPAEPAVLIEAVLVGGRPLAPDVPGFLPYDPGPITIRFAAPSFADESAVRFRYRLTGLSEVWREAPAGQGETTYGGLGAGRYVFEVTARTGDGRVSRAPALYSFAVRPVWWHSRTAISAAALLLLGVIWGVVRTREGRLKAQRRRLEHEVADRTEELRRANERLAAQAVTDDLTGLANRRRATQAVNEAIAFARRRKTPLSVALADLDHFKELNDTRGHAEGDRFLVRASQAMQLALRTEDLLGRWGGEEFLAVLPGSDAAGARAAAERLRLAIEEMGEEVGLGGAAARRLTVSLGVATFDGEAAEGAELIRRADEALYRAKALGRNRVVAFEELPRAGS